MSASSRFVVGLEGPALAPAEREAYTKDLPAGFLLLPRNLESAAQAAALTSGLRALGEPSPLLFVDQEGGTVDRLGPLLGQPFPSAAETGAAGSDRVHESAFLMGKAARLLGFDADLAPCLDLFQPGAGEIVLAGRSFGLHAEDVVVAGMMFLHGLARAGIASCLKHFPGLGRAAADTHETLPVVDAHGVDLMVTDVAPFKRLAGMADGILVGHAAYPDLSGGIVPASLSPAIYALLRGPLGFAGTVFSDDLTMGALSGPLPERALAASAAGCDLMVVTRPGDAWGEMLRRPGAEAEPGEIAEARERRVARFRERCASAPRTPYSPQAWDELSAAVAALREALARPREVREI